MSVMSEDIAVQSHKILQTFIQYGGGHKLALHHIIVYKIFLTLRSHIFISFQPITLKLGNFADFKMLFPAVLMDFH